jgi:PKD repeat protein
VLITVVEPPNTAPIATVTAAPLTGVAPLPVTFSSAGSTDADGRIVSFAWAFGDGGTSSEPFPAYTYPTPGAYVVTLTVTDDDGASASAALTVVVSAPPVNKPPVAVLTASATSGVAPINVAFSSAGSADPDGSIASFAWTFGDGTSSGDGNPSHTYAAVGSFVVSLTVTDNAGASATTSLTIVVSAAPSRGTVMLVQGIAMEVVPYQTTQIARAHVTVVDDTGKPVANAAVTGRWYGLLASPAVYAITDANGRATFSSKYLFQTGAIGFTMLGIIREGLVYDPARNVESKAQIFVDKLTP